MVDNFTLRHLSEYADVSVFECEREDFITFALTELAQDAELAEYGWPSLYRRFLYERDA